MKFIFTSLCILLSVAAWSQSPNPKYDKALADSLGGDEYGMKMYVMVILKTGTNTTASKQVSDSLFNGHMENIMRLANAGKLIVSGPLKKNDMNYRGIFILNVQSLFDAHALLATDPALQAKLLEAEMFQWYGSAALPVYLPVHEKIERVRM